VSTEAGQLHEAQPKGLVEPLEVECGQTDGDGVGRDTTERVRQLADFRLISPGPSQQRRNTRVPEAGAPDQQTTHKIRIYNWVPASAQPNVTSKVDPNRLLE